MHYLWAFIVGGILCAIGQIILDKTKITPARILVLYVVVGTILGFLGVYQPLVDFAGAGASVPLTGFGNSLAKATIKAINEKGLIGIFQGLSGAAGGIGAALFFGFVAALISKPKEK